MSERSITYAIIGLTLSITYGYLNKLSRKPVQLNSSGNFRLQMSRLYSIVGYVGISFGLVMILGPLILVKEKWDVFMYVIFLSCFFLFIMLGSFSVLCYKNHIVIFDDNLIQVQNAFKETRSVRWEDIHKARFNSLTGFISITDRNGKKVKIHYHLIGLTTFLRSLEAKTQFTASKLKLPAGF